MKFYLLKKLLSTYILILVEHLPLTEMEELPEKNSIAFIGLNLQYHIRLGFVAEKCTIEFSVNLVFLTRQFR